MHLFFLFLVLSCSGFLSLSQDGAALGKRVRDLRASVLLQVSWDSIRLWSLGTCCSCIIKATDCSRLYNYKKCIYKRWNVYLAPRQLCLVRWSDLRLALHLNNIFISAVCPNMDYISKNVGVWYLVLLYTLRCLTVHFCHMPSVVVCDLLLSLLLMRCCFFVLLSSSRWSKNKFTSYRVEYQLNNIGFTWSKCSTSAIIESM